MNHFVFELPDELRAEVARRADGEPDRKAAWVAQAVREKLAADAELEYLKQRAVHGSREE